MTKSIYKSLVNANAYTKPNQVIRLINFVRALAPQNQNKRKSSSQQKTRKQKSIKL